MVDMAEVVDMVNMVEMMDSLLGPNKRRHNEGLRQFGLPQAPKTREELTVERAMESCTFKTVMSCVLGKASFILSR